MGRRQRPDPARRPSALVAALYEWRDSIARRLDESTGYVLSRAQLLKLAQALPKTTAGELHRPGLRWLARLLAAMPACLPCPDMGR